MATLLLSAVGTAIGGPLGGAVGALIGQQVDSSLIGGGKSREGPRLKELEVTTSSYGMPIARHFGSVRKAGTIIWSTDLIENKESSGGGKKQPKVTSFSYSVSFAVALSSRPIKDLGRIWADGNLLRGAAGDLKSGGSLRIYDGYGDNAVDPLIASAQGANTPAYRGFAYAVFEDLQLADFGNRIPALTFEIIADDGEVALTDMLEPLPQAIVANLPLNNLRGFSDEGQTIAGNLAAVERIYPLALDASGDAMSMVASDAIPAEPLVLAPATGTTNSDSFGAQSGAAFLRQAGSRNVPDALRYYDKSRDYQTGMQRADGKAQIGRNTVIELPGVFEANDARMLINRSAERARLAQETIVWRTAELDSGIGPGWVVKVPDQAGHWLVEAWEWREDGVELELRRLPITSTALPTGDAGNALTPPDLTIDPSWLFAFELPWDGVGSPDTPQILAAVSAQSAGWKGATLYSENNSQLSEIGFAGRERSVIGTILEDLPASQSVLLEYGSSLLVELAAEDLLLSDTDWLGLSNGANLAVVGEELIQFGCAEHLSGRQWRISHLLRGRGGTEGKALAGQLAGAAFALVDNTATRLDSADLGDRSVATIAAIGLADAEPVYAPLANGGIATRPLTPVHADAQITANGELHLCWVRRARGAWNWPDGIDAPLVEQAEQYRVGLGEVDDPILVWQTSVPQLNLDAATYANLVANHPGAQLWLQQIGTYALSGALHLHTIN